MSTAFELTIILFTIVAYIATMYLLLKPTKRNPEYLPVGTVLLVKYEHENYTCKNFYSAVVENNETTAADMNREWQKTYLDGKRIISYEYITPPKP
jgi:hypothetical protein